MSADQEMDTGAVVPQEERTDERKKKVRFSDEEVQIEVPSGSGGDQEIEAQDGGPDGAAAPGGKRKRDPEDQRDKGMDIDSVESINSLGAMLSSISMVDPEVKQWVSKVNEGKASHVGVSPSGVADGYAAGGETDRQRSGENPSTDVADGDAGGGGGGGDQPG